MFWVHTYVKGSMRHIVTKEFHSKWDAKRMAKKVRALPNRHAVISWDCLNEDCVPSPTMERREAMTDHEMLLCCGTLAQLVCDKERRLHHVRTAIISTATEFAYCAAIDAIDSAIKRRFGGMLDLENDLHPFGHGEEREEGIAVARMCALDCAYLTRERILIHCDDEYRDEMFAGTQHEYPHPDDVHNVLPDPMDFNAVY